MTQDPDHDPNAQDPQGMDASPDPQRDDAREPEDYLSGRNRGYAFVRMSDSATSLKAIMELNVRLFRNRPIRLGWSFR